MSKTWKWILGILLFLVVVGGMFAIGTMWQTHRTLGAEFERGWSMPMVRQWGNELPALRNHPMMISRGIRPIARTHPLVALLKLAVLFALIAGAYWLGRRNARITLDPKPAAPAAEPASAPPRKGK